MRFDESSDATGRFYDELIDAVGNARPHAAELVDYFGTMHPKELVARQRAVGKTIVDMGISFTIYSEGDNRMPIRGAGAGTRRGRARPSP